MDMKYCSNHCALYIGLHVLGCICIIMNCALLLAKNSKILNSITCAIINGELSIQNLNPDWEGQ